MVHIHLSLCHGGHGGIRGWEEREEVRVVEQLVQKGKRKKAREPPGLSKKPLMLSSFEAVVTSCDQTTCALVPRPPFDLESISSLCYKRTDPIKSPQLATYAAGPHDIHPGDNRCCICYP